MQPTSHILWNLFLALIPVALSAGIVSAYRRNPELRSRRWVWIALALVWLGFLPNTCYLITEWRHFIEYVMKNPEDVRAANHGGQALIQFLGVLSFYILYTGAGLMAFTMSIWSISQIAQPKPAVKATFFLVCALGVYLGLIQRLNTWDLLHRPAVVAQASVDALTRPLLLLLMVGLAAVLWGAYWVVEVFADGLQMRLRRPQS